MVLLLCKLVEEVIKGRALLLLLRAGLVGTVDRLLCDGLLLDQAFVGVGAALQLALGLAVAGTQ
jgi:hypothetical protein